MSKKPEQDPRDPQAEPPSKSEPRMGILPVGGPIYITPPRPIEREVKKAREEPAP